MVRTRKGRQGQEPKAEKVIDDLDQLRTISDPLRLRIIELMGEAPVRSWTAKELAHRLKTGQTKLYHHLNLLEEHDFVRVAETRLVSGITEKRYVVTALSFRVDRSLFSGATGEAAVADIVDAVFDKARSEIVAAQRAGLIDFTEDDADRRGMAMWASHARLSPAGLRKVRRLVEKLSSEFDDLEEADGSPFGLLVSLYPRISTTDEESDR